MSHLEVPRFPRGFLLTDRPIDPPHNFVPGPILPNFHVHPWLNVETAGNQDLFVIVLGHCVPTRPTQNIGAPAALLSELSKSEGCFLKALDDYAGRHAIIYGSADNIRMVNDATAMRSVFYAADGGVVASHALLVDEALGGKPQKKRLVFAYGYPGNRTPYDRARILTPNTVYSFSAHRVHRFWPLTASVERDVDSVVAEVMESTIVAFRAMGSYGPVKMALTAGLDSRVMLAVGLYSGVKFETYTYGDNRATALDRAFAPDLAAHADVRHTLVPRTASPDGLQRALREANYSPSHVGAVPGLVEYFGDPKAVSVTGNLLEIGQSFYNIHKARGVAEPLTPETMAELHVQSMPLRSRQRIEDHGLEQYFETAHEAFQGFMTDTEYEASAGLLDPFDQFYWEHRMGTWHGPLLLERDFYGVPFIPFNSRRVFEAMLGLPQADRDEATLFHRMLELMNPRLLQFPINPKRWPAKSS